MTKVLFIVNSLNPGGAERHVVSLLNHLDLREFSCRTAHLHPGAALLDEIRSDRIGAVVSCVVRRKVDLGVVRSLAEIIDRDEVDAVLCTNLYSLLYGLLARMQAKRRPRIIEVFHTTLLGSWRMRLQMAFYWPLFLQCDHLVYVCANQRRHWRRLGLRARSDSFIYNGIDTNHFSLAAMADAAQGLRLQLGLSSADFVIGICAGLRQEKAHVDLIEAVARLRSEGVPARLLIIGDGPERTNIERRIAIQALQEDVTIVGFQADVRPWVAACDVMAIVSHAVETFSISALESMSLERPMVMSRIGGADEQVSDGVNGLLFDAGDISALTNCLRKLVDPVERRRLGVNARKVVTTRFGIAEMVASYAVLLRSLAGRH